MTIEVGDRIEAIETDWFRCPECGSNQIEGGSVTIEGTEAWQEVGCLECECAWVEVYEASHRLIEEVTV